MDIQQAFGQVLRNLREDQGFSQEKLAQKTGLDRTFISMLERGIRQPSLKTIFQLANVLGKFPSDFISEVERIQSETIKD